MMYDRSTDRHSFNSSVTSTQSSQSRILIADDHDLIRETIASFLGMRGFDDVECVGTLDEAITSVESWGNFDMVLLDLDMPGMNGLDGLRRMVAICADTPVAIISGTNKFDIVQSAIDAGARGFIPKTMPAKSISAAIGFMIAGEVFAPYHILQKAPESNEAFDLKPREKQVLSGLSEGLSNKEIALKLELHEVTVKLHVKTLSRKLNARNRTHAAMIARDHGLV